MRCTAIKAFVVAAVLLAANVGVKADAVGDAYRICAAFDGTGLAAKCDVSGRDASVKIRLDTNRSEARKICFGVSELIAGETRSFSGKWKLKIYSPYSGDHPLAVCTLR